MSVDGSRAGIKGGKIPGHREKEQAENMKRVQRQKLEKVFMSSIQKGGMGGRLTEYETLRQKHIEHMAPVPASRRDAANMPDMQRKIEEAKRAAKIVPKGPVYQPIRRIGDFEGQIRCLEATQGGATLWCGEDDGRISIRNGKTGAEVHHINGSDGMIVNTLYSTDTHMWVGLNDGTVRIYDHLVYILVAEEQHHTDAVTCFTETQGDVDHKVFSSGLDSQIIKWDTEANNFEIMAKWTSESGQKINCLACYGYQLFVGGDGAGDASIPPVVLSIDSENGTVVRRFEGHQKPITSLLVQDGFLFSGSGDMTVRAWDMESGECIFPLGSADPEKPVGHEAPVTGLIGDPVAHRFWSSDALGVIHVWESTPENDFKHLYELKDHAEGHPITCLRNFCTVDAVKMWSITSRGENRCWYSAVNKSEDCISQTVDAMESIITQDLVELAKWRELVEKLEGIDSERKRKLGEAMMLTTDEARRRWRFQQWKKLLMFRQRKRRQQLAAAHLCGKTDRAIRYINFCRLEHHAHQGKTARRKQAITTALLTNTNTGMKLLYWRKARAFVETKKRENRMKQTVDCLLGCHQRGIQRRDWRKWRKYTDGARTRRKKQLVANSLMMCTDRGQQRVYYQKLADHVRFRQARERKLTIADTILRCTTLGLRRSTYLRWREWRDLMRRRKQKTAHTKALSLMTGKAVQARYFAKLQHQALAGRVVRVKQDIADEEQRKKNLKIHYDRKGAILEQLQKLQALQNELDGLRQDREQMLQDKEDKKAELDRLRLQVKQRKDNREELEKKAEAEIVADTMSILKSTVLNYHIDYPLIDKTRKNVEPLGKVPVVKIFLEMHIQIKRIVVEVTKTETIPGERWKGLTDSSERKKDGKLHKIESHHKMGLLGAIKTMVICYDMMSEDIKQQLETNAEISNNVKELIEMAKIGKAEEDKRRGTAHRFAGMTDPDGKQARSPSRSRNSKSKQGTKQRSQSADSPRQSQKVSKSSEKRQSKASRSTQ